jgi:serine/threonine protein kinase
MATLTGTTLGKYQILERLGRGGMADVYKAHHARLDRHVAIKVLHPHLIEGQDFLPRFEREAQAVASLKHPHIVQVFDFDSQDDLHYIVMELIDGGSLHGRLLELAGGGARMPQKEALRVLKDVASAIDYAHARGMLHRDIKPANVLLDHDGDAFLSDFGIARIMSDTQFTTTGALIGTPQYMSPEQGMGLPLSEATDLYSLGVVLYEMLTGRAPFDSDTPLGVIHKHVHEPLPSPRLACPDLPRAVEDVLLKALAKRPDDRYPSAGQMLRALEDGMAPVEDKAIDRTLPARRPESVPPEPAASGPSPENRTDKPLAGPSPVEPTRSPLPTVAMEGQSEGVPPAPGLRPTLVTKGPPGAGRRRLTTVWRILLGVALVAILGAALSIGLPRVMPAATASPTATAAVRPSPSAPGEAAELANFIRLATEAMHSQRYRDAIDSYARARDLVPTEQQPAYAYLMCDVAQAHFALEQKELALLNLQRCIDWTQGEPGGAELRAEAERQKRAISSDPFGDKVAAFEPGPQANSACADPSSALGPPDFDPDVPRTFLCLGRKGIVDVEFVNNLAIDGPGADLAVRGDPDQNDTWRVRVSLDGENWADFGVQPEVVELDLATVGLAKIRFIRLEDTGSAGPGPFAGGELDSVEALHSEPAG